MRYTNTKTNTNTNTNVNKHNMQLFPEFKLWVGTKTEGRLAGSEMKPMRVEPNICRLCNDKKPNKTLHSLREAQSPAMGRRFCFSLFNTLLVNLGGVRWLPRFNSQISGAFT